MPSGVYQRTADQLKVIKANLAKGRLPEARKKATKKLKKLGLDPEWRKRVSKATKKAMNKPEVRQKHLAGLALAWEKYGPRFKGGKGGSPTEMAKLFASVLEPLGYVMEYAISTKPIRKLMPDISMRSEYNVDFGHPKKKIAIELDGPCHNSMKRKAIDEKKTLVLENLGWKVIRIKHK